MSCGDDTEIMPEEQDEDVLTTEEDADEFSDTDVLEKDDFSDTAVYEGESHVHDLVGESSVVFEMDDLMAELEAEASIGDNAANRVRKRLEAIAERKRRHSELIDFEDYDFDV